MKETEQHGSGSPKPNFPVRDGINTSQIGALIDTLAALQPYLLLTQREFDARIPKDLDGGIQSASVATFCGVCDRLDKIIADDSRWALTSVDELYESSLKTQKAMITAHEAQANHLKTLGRPSHTLQPQFTKTTTGLFVAFWGDPEVPGGLIVGKGLTPAEALADFDSAFTRHEHEQVKLNAESLGRLTARQQVEQPEPGAAPEVPQTFKAKFLALFRRS